MFEISKENIKQFRIKTIKEKSYSYSNGVLSDVPNEISVAVYDNKGNNVAQLTEQSQSYYEYDDNDNIIRDRYESNMNRYENSFQIIYDNNGKIIKEIKTPIPNNISSTTEYKYDSKGLLIEEVVYSKLLLRKIIEDKRIYSYNDLGHRIAENYGSITISNEFDKKGNKLKSTVYNSDGTIQCIWSNKYDDRNNKIEFKSERFDVPTNQKDIFIYNNENLLIEKTSCYNADEPDTHYFYLYEYYDSL